MTQLFLAIFDYFQRNRSVFWISFGVGVSLLIFGATRIEIEEDISKFFPDDERVKKIDYVLKNSSFAERLTVMVSVSDSVNRLPTDSLVHTAEKFIEALDTAASYLQPIHATIDDSNVVDLLQSVQQNLPVFLTEDDYRSIDSLIRQENVSRILAANYKQLISPSGLFTKNVIVNDPLGISFIVLRKLQSLQYDRSFELYDNYIVTRDGKTLLFFLYPRYPASDTGHNAELIELLDFASNRHSSGSVTVSYFGGVAVAVGNAKQLQRDSILTISLTLVIIGVVLIGYFRRKRSPFLVFIPVVFGALFALCFVYLIQGSIAILAIAGGSIILGIAVNYSLHFLVHAGHVRSIRDTIADLVYPMTLGGTTTVLAFFSLQFVNASVLKDLGLFAGLSLIGAALCTLVFLPQLVGSFAAGTRTSEITSKRTPALLRSAITFWLIVILTPFFLYFARDVRFDTDIGHLNFMKPELRAAQERLEEINKSTLAASYIVTQESSFEKALRKNENATTLLNQLHSKNNVQKFTSISTLILSDSIQEVRIKRWKEYWNDDRINSTMNLVVSPGRQLNFSPRVFENFRSLLTREYEKLDSSTLNLVRGIFFNDLIIEKDDVTTIINVANVNPGKKAETYSTFEEAGFHAVDRQMITNIFVEYVHADFNFIVAFTSGLVFIALLVAYGRIELTLITFLPMLITWIWILGIMAFVGIEFNIVNVMISTFIFGLGDDYSIFTMDGLQQRYKTGKENLPSIRISIFLSAVTTITGLGVLIFAEHPALRSIAAISIIGIVCVFVMSQALEPFLFRWLITSRVSRGLPPMTFFGLAKTIFTYVFFVTGSVFLTAVGIFLKLIPSKGTRYFYHSLLRFYTWTLIALTPRLKRTIVNGNLFRQPSVIIANHSSFLDILLTIGLHPKVILLTNKWVWNSPVFGGVVRLADYYPVAEGAEESVARLSNRVNEGYSIVVFPEGTRSADGSISRFHKGAFYIAESLKIPIQPLLIHGAAHAIPKNTMYVNNGSLVLKFLPAIDHDDRNVGNTYSERTKSISRYVKAEFELLRSREETPLYFRHKLIASFLYKGPVLEWYTRIKIRLENYYEPFHRLIPLNASVIDLGCGYGYLPLMLHYLSANRQIVGVDYDEEKILTANHVYSKGVQLRFVHSDIQSFSLDKYDVIVIADVLHYLTSDIQDEIIVKCINALNPGGKLIIREGNADLKERHQGTRLTELFSVKILKFNKSLNDLHFLSGSHLATLASQQGCAVRILDETKFTSNVIFVVEKES